MRYRERKNIRLSGYRYDAPGAYYVTICTHDRACIFGEIIDGEMRLNDSGRIVEEEWLRSAVIRREITLDAFVVMPNHIHGIVIINDDTSDQDVGAHGRAPLHDDINRAPLHDDINRPPQRDDINRPPLHDDINRPPQHTEKLHRLPRSLGSFVAGFKSSATKRINTMRNTPGFSVWQRNYYDHIVRDESDLNRIRKYIRDNPMRWHLDRDNDAQVDNDGWR